MLRTRIAITDRRGLDLRRRPRHVLASIRDGVSGTRGDRVRRLRLPLPRRRRRAAHRRCGPSRWRGGRAARAPCRSPPLLAGGALRRPRRARGLERCRVALRRAACRGHHRVGGGGIDVGERRMKTSSPTAAAMSPRTPLPLASAAWCRARSRLPSASTASVTCCPRLHEFDRRARLRAALLALGEHDVLLSGGTDGCVLPGMIFGFSRMRAVSTHNDRPAEASRPFDCGRDGSCSARAPGWSRSSATGRGPRGTHLRLHRGLRLDLRCLPPRRWIPKGEIVRCLREALAHRPRPEEIGYVNYHGTSTPLNDAIESRCTRLALGAAADQVPGSSTSR